MKSKIARIFFGGASGISYTLSYIGAYEHMPLESLLLPFALGSYFLGCFITLYAIEDSQLLSRKGGGKQ